MSPQVPESRPSYKERFRMALAEAGYPEASVTGPDDDPHVLLSGPNAVPDRVCWLAHRIAHPERGRGLPCWECWKLGFEECTAGLTEDCGRDRSEVFA